MPTNSKVCPCALFVDIAKHGLTGNCHLFNVNGSSVSDGAILGINTHFPLLTPLAISTYIKYIFPQFQDYKLSAISQAISRSCPQVS